MSDEAQNMQQAQADPPADQDAASAENENLTSDADGVAVGQSVNGEYNVDEPVLAVVADAPDALDEIALREEEAESQGAAVSDAFFEEDQPIAADIPSEGADMIDDEATDFMAERVAGIDETDAQYIAAQAAEESVADAIENQGATLPQETEVRVDVTSPAAEVPADTSSAAPATEGTVDTVLGVAADDALADIAPGGVNDAIADAVADSQTYSAANNSTLDAADTALDVPAEVEVGEATQVDDDVLPPVDAALATTSDADASDIASSALDSSTSAPSTSAPSTSASSTSDGEQADTTNTEGTLLDAVGGAIAEMADSAAESVSNIVDSAPSTERVTDAAASATDRITGVASAATDRIVETATDATTKAVDAVQETVQNAQEQAEASVDSAVNSVANSSDSDVPDETQSTEEPSTTGVEAQQESAPVASEPQANEGAISEPAAAESESAASESIASESIAAETTSTPVDQDNAIDEASTVGEAEFAASDSPSPSETVQVEVEPEPVADMVAQAGVIAQGDEGVMDEVVAEGAADEQPPARIPDEDVPEENVTEAVDEDGERQTVRTLAVGEQVNGVVKRLTDFGAFIDIGVGRDGLVHISELAIGRVEKVSDVLSKGQEVTMWIKKLDRKRNRISLTMIDPDRKTIRDLSEGEIVEGTVTRILPYGAFIDIGVGRDALLHVREMSNRYVEKPEDVVSMDEKLEARIIALSRRRKRVDLSLKGLRDEPESEEPEAEKIAPREQEPEVAEPEEIEVLSPMELAFKRAMEADGDDVEVPDKHRTKSKRRTKKQSRALQDEIVARTLEGREG